jgi:hypothetical protein
MFWLVGMVFGEHGARAQGNVDAFALASTRAELYFEIVGDPGPGDRISISLALIDPLIVEQDGGDAAILIRVGGTLAGAYVGDRPGPYLLGEPGQEAVSIDPFNVDLSGFGEGEVIRLVVSPLALARAVPEPGPLLLLLGGTLVKLLGRWAPRRSQKATRRARKRLASCRLRAPDRLPDPVQPPLLDRRPNRLRHQVANASPAADSGADLGGGDIDQRAVERVDLQLANLLG